VPDESAFSLADFDRYLEEHGIPEEEVPAAFAHWLGEQMERTPLRFQKVEPGDEQVLPPIEQREIAALPSGLDRSSRRTGSPTKHPAGPRSCSPTSRVSRSSVAGG
jgi:hypothetical protein